MHNAALPDQATQASDRNPARPFSKPYRSTPIFDLDSLPAALKREHRTKQGTWAVIRVIEGQLRYWPDGGGTPCIVTATDFVVVAPQVPHHVEPIGAMMMQVDFYDHEPFLPPP